ncbi:GNAT family N-acetyltransferase [Sedimentitalea sp. XS_ASV28]|uniref:GNAT family N-acetyltransferase n=1 Tax=Sedimentitalea sp. XS_ASV28 TaxID=3241296 RepID=UPI003511AF5B
MNISAATDMCADLWEELEAAFADPERREYRLPPDLPLRALRCARPDGVITRAGFHQSAPLWIRHEPQGWLEARNVASPDGRDHPLRAPKPCGLVYERHDPVARLSVSFRTVDPELDLDRFHRWQNDPRVAFFWEENKPRAELKTYLEDRLADPHCLPLIGCFDGDEAGYFEAYWAREDRLGPYYESLPWDRGWHGLIGERRHLGRRKTAAWLRGLSHYLFLDCPMTTQLVGEPRFDNAKLLSYADALAYEKLKEFDFPHKRSALMRCARYEFFGRVL